MARFRSLLACCAVALLGLPALADAPHVYAITGARIITAAGAPIDNGSVVLRQGVIDAVGSSVTIPTGARIIDAKGLTVYPGLIERRPATSVARRALTHLNLETAAEHGRRSGSTVGEAVKV